MFAFQTGISILLMPVIGGIGVWGPVLGGVVFGVVEEQISVNFPNLHLMIYGSLLIVIILLEPEGLLGLLQLLVRRFRGKREDPGSPDADQVLWGRGPLKNVSFNMRRNRSAVYQVRTVRAKLRFSA